jgi:hypothetical protein
MPPIQHFSEKLGLLSSNLMPHSGVDKKQTILIVINLFLLKIGEENKRRGLTVEEGSFKKKSRPPCPPELKSMIND